jgi:hypothetical protein
MRHIHNGGGEKHRMPLFFTKAFELLWMKEGLTDAEMRQLFAFEMPEEELEYDTVYTIRTKKERPDGKGKLEHYSWKNLPPLGTDSNALELF